MSDEVLVLGTAAVALVCCFVVSLLAATGATALLGLAGLALPAAMLIGVAGWIGWYVARRRSEGNTR